MRRVDLAGMAVEATSGAPLVVLREQDEPHRLLPILVGGPEAAAIALSISGEAPPRPLTHDLMAALVRSLDGRIDAVELTELRDGSFLARLAFHGPTGQQRLDTRPSDAIALAVRLDAPLFVSEAVLDEAGTLPRDDEDDEVLDDSAIDETAIDDTAIDDTAIDDAVAEFRSFLDDVDPAHFAEQPGDHSTGIDDLGGGADEIDDDSGDGEGEGDEKDDRAA